jgi:hypothetical protein
MRRTHVLQGPITVLSFDRAEVAMHLSCSRKGTRITVLK